MYLINLSTLSTCSDAAAHLPGKSVQHSDQNDSFTDGWMLHSAATSFPTPSHESFTKIKTHKTPGVAVKHAEMIMTMAMAMMILIKVPLVMMNLG